MQPESRDFHTLFFTSGRSCQGIITFVNFYAHLKLQRTLCCRFENKFTLAHRPSCPQTEFLRIRSVFIILLLIFIDIKSLRTILTMKAGIFPESLLQSRLLSSHFFPGCLHSGLWLLLFPAKPISWILHPQNPRSEFLIHIHK